MPPRRSARNSLPTPAQSSKADSTASGSPPVKVAGGGKKVKIEAGLMTPASMTSGTFEDGEDVELDFGGLAPNCTELENGLEAVATSSKRERRWFARPALWGLTRLPAEIDSTDIVKFELNGESTVTTMRTARRVIESVVVPSRRSKLATEKTDSLDNLTLEGETKGQLNGAKDERLDADVSTARLAARSIRSQTGARPPYIGI
jgi:hypothetical protein